MYEPGVWSTLTSHDACPAGSVFARQFSEPSESSTILPGIGAPLPPHGELGDQRRPSVAEVRLGVPGLSRIVPANLPAG